MALLLPAITSAVGTARDAGVTAEIVTISTALEDFKSKYGEYPPSRIALVESGAYAGGFDPPVYSAPGVAADIMLSDLKARTVRAMKKFFPRSTHFQGGSAVDWNRDGDTADVVILQGHEALVFFLGGIAEQNASGEWGMTGFAKNPLNPFLPALAVGGANRQAPLFEFKPERLIDEDGDGFPGYVDTLGTSKFYAYFASYGTGNYDPNDVNFPPPPGGATPGAGSETAPDFVETTDAGVPFREAFAVGFAVQANALNTPLATPARPANRIAVSPAPNPYTSGPPLPAGAAAATWQKAQSFQIISAGRDGLYGLGGAYTPSGTDPLPGDQGLRARERDNLTSFSSGKLD